MSTAYAHKLPTHCILRYTPNPDLIEYNVPSAFGSDTEDNDTISPPHLTPDRDTFSDAFAVQTPINNYEDEDDYISPEAAALARKLGGEDEADFGAASENNSSPFHFPKVVHFDDGDWGYCSQNKTAIKEPPATYKAPKSKAMPKEKKSTPAKAKVPKTPKTPGSSSKRGVDKVNAGGEKAGSSTAKKPRLNADGTPRERKKTVKAQAVGM